MAIYRKDNYRKIYEEARGPIPKDQEGRTYDIHHIDGNRENNDLSNLVALSIQDHYDLHFKQGDYSACLLISYRMKVSPEEKSKLASLNAKKQLLNGAHPWTSESYKQKQKQRAQSDSNPFRGGDIQRESHKKRLETGKHHLLGSSVNNKMLLEGRHSSQKVWSCEHCGKVGKNTTNYKRFHGLNCKAL